MRPRSSGLLCALLLLSAQSLSAQSTGPLRALAWLSFGDGIGVAGGGSAVGGSTALSQVIRLSGTAVVFRDHGLDVTAVRVQTLSGASGRFSDPDFDNPNGDGIILSYATTATGRGGGIPAAFTIGGGVMRRKTSDPDRTHDTWVARLAYDGLPAARFRTRFDFSVGAQALIMPARSGKSYVVTFGGALRVF